SSGEARALAEADRLARGARRHLVLVGGSDNHWKMILPTTWVFAKEDSEQGILAGLRAGATCVGGPEAGSLRARGGLDPEGTWVGIGGTISAERKVSLRFTGKARVFVDGVDRGVFDGGFSSQADPSPHTYRIVAGESRSGFIYANF